MTRIAVVDNEKLKDIQKKKYIQSLCPVNRRGEDCIYFEGEKLRIDEELCIGCGICANAAPEAISIINLPEELDEDPIHRYGENGFALFSLPTPMFGKVIGVIGRNGIGKSTAIKILSGNLKANLGKDKANVSDLIDHFKGTESQRFFEKIRDGEIVCSYKPQNVEEIPRMYDGKVRELLEKVDDNNNLGTISEKLDLSKILDNDIDSISGGELQRVAIAAAVLKDANFYVFDEPTSYLDVKQRIKISKFIKALADEKTSVMVVEHDLIILDYMTDLTHIMYGKPGAYGIVSMPKTTKSGINAYLSGFIREDNIRFRDKKISFTEKSPVERKTTSNLIEWHNIEKKLGNFKLEAPEGKLHEERVVGMLGENAIGKTSFVKILAGVIESKGEIKDSVKVSYKPQYLKPSDDLVANVVRTALKKYKAQLIHPLGIEPLLDRKLSELSGGELQRVAVCACLAKDADLYLLDEPSAYLDVELRLAVSKMLQNIMHKSEKTCLVVDHDLLFVDYISDELIVCEGEPAEYGVVKGPFDMEKGMNLFLKDLGVTFRRDPETGRPRANKPESVMDRKQKNQNKLYYT